MRIGIHLVLETEKPDAAQSVLSAVNAIIDAGEPHVEPYHKGGTSARFEKQIPDMDWPGAVLQCLLLAQSFGYAWSITGSADDEIELVSSRFAVPGIEWGHVWMNRLREPGQ